MPRHSAPIVMSKSVEGRPDLLEVIDAYYTLGLTLGIGQHGQQNRRQDPNDGNNHQKFNESESADST